MEEKDLDGIDVEGGNTKTPSKKQTSQRLHWGFTFNNYEKHHIDVLHSLFANICHDWIFQEEIGEKEKTPHLQGAISLKKAMRWTEFTPDKRINWKAQISLNNSTYASKLNTRAPDGVIKWGGSYKPKVELKLITTLRPWQEEIRNLCMTEPDDRTINWFWEPEGSIGKSVFIKYMVAKHNALLCQGGKHSDIMNLVFKQDMDRTNIILFDIPRANKGNVSYTALECIKNGMVCNTKYETGVKLFNSPHVIVFANFLPGDEGQLSKDRWKITEMV